MYLRNSVTDPDPDPRINQSEVWIRILLSPSKKSKKNLDSYCFVTSFWLFILENDVRVPSRSNKQKNFFKKLVFCCHLGRSMTKIAGSGSASWSESGWIGRRYGSADPDPDPPQNVMDPQHCLKFIVSFLNLCPLAGRYDNPIPTRFLAPTDCSKIPAQNV